MQAQTFSGGAHVRDSNQKLEQIFQDASAQYLLVAERKIYTLSTRNIQEQGLGWLSLESLCELVHVQSKEGMLVSGQGDSVPTYMLGVMPSSGRLALAVDVSELLSVAEGPLSAIQGQFIDLRSLLASTLPLPELALAGHAAALSQWHQTHKFCPRCGGPTSPVECGTKRQCPEKHRLYPRTDPVVIMLIESPDGHRALLGRSKKVPAGVLTCLAGFVDQAESVEEAVARECKEEAGVAVSMVQIIGSQPWPIGRAGSCELMLGCVGRAVSEDMKINSEEMDECRWVTRDELSQAIERSKIAKFSMSGPFPLPPPGSFSVPPSWAIAHHLMLHWLNKQSATVKSGASKVP